MSLKPWKKLSEEIIHENPWWVYKIKKFIAHHGEEVDYHVVSANGFSMIVAVDEDGKIPMVKQWRPTLECESLEFPAGGIEEGQKPAQCAKEEFAQECGLVARSMKCLGGLFVSPGKQDTHSYTFIAHDLIQTTEAHPDKNEQIEVIRLTPEAIEQKIVSGEIRSSDTIAAWHFAKPHILRIIDEQRHKK